MAETTATYVTCHCQHCEGKIEFDARQLGEGETRIVDCPHCQLSTAISLPEPQVPPVSPPKPDDEAAPEDDTVRPEKSGAPAPRLFDLNIEQILENWETCHALRELIANAIDEQVISKTKPIGIFKDTSGNWHVRDFGRGLRIEHLTLNECQEKLQVESGIIGKFGVGLKDALATLHRHGVQVCIHSSHGQFSLTRASKHGFDGVVTLHVECREPEFGFQGTDIQLTGGSDSDIALARGFFLKFSEETLLEETTLGQIIQRKPETARIYINGVFAAEESDFLFSYNIMNLTPAMRKNERMHGI